MTVHRRGRTRDIAAYFFDNPNKDITINVLEKHFRGLYDREQIMTSVNYLIVGRPDREGSGRVSNLRRITNGVWRLELNGDSASQTAPDKQETIVETPPQVIDQLMHVEVLKERANFLLVEDVSDGKLYKMYLVG